MTDLLTSSQSTGTTTDESTGTATTPPTTPPTTPTTTPTTTPPTSTPPTTPTTSTPAPTLPPEAPAGPLRPPVADPPPRRRWGGWRFVGGVLTGAALTGLGLGAATLVGSGDEPAGSAPDVVDEPGEASAPPITAVPGSVHALVVQVRPSIVAIHTTVTTSDIFGRQLEGEAAGSGFVLSADGYVVTNDHVVDGAETITVTFDDGTAEEAELIGADPRSDLAVLRVDRDDLTPLPIGDSDAIQVGDPVVAIGNALDLGAEPTVTGGMISAKHRTITEQNGQVLVDLVQTDAAISPGNSGGPLVDLRGRVVGINTAIAGQGQNIGFAIAINPALDLIEQLRDGEVPRHALLGVSTRPNPDGVGALVAAVDPGSGADRGGIEVGDVIVGLGDDEVADPSELVVAIARHRPEDEVTVTVERNGRERALTITLGAHDETPS